MQPAPQRKRSCSQLEPFIWTGPAGSKVSPASTGEVGGRRGAEKFNVSGRRRDGLVGTRGA